MTPLTVTSDVLDHIRDHAAAAYPAEACGLLIGRNGRVDQAVRADNLSDRPQNSFEIDPALILHWQKTLRGGQGDKTMPPRRIIGHYHSHPDHPAQPSARDRARIYDPGLVWAIVGVTAAGPQEINFFSTEDGDFRPLGIVVP